jgi:hypothetical protein
MSLAFQSVVAAPDFSEQAAVALEYGGVVAGGLAHFFMGSVAERVVRSAPCPVFTVRDIEALRCASREVVTAMAS